MAATTQLRSVRAASVLAADAAADSARFWEHSAKSFDCGSGSGRCPVDEDVGATAVDPVRNVANAVDEMLRDASLKDVAVC